MRGNSLVKSQAFTSSLTDIKGASFEFFARYREDFRPLVEGCGCYCCRNHKRAYLHHLLVTNELLAGVLLMIHNPSHYQGFFSALREALATDKLDLLKRRVHSKGHSPEEKNKWALLIKEDGAGWYFFFFSVRDHQFRVTVDFALVSRFTSL